MDDDSRIRGLLEELLNTGRTPEEVCVDRPDLLEIVRARWLRIRELAEGLERAFPSAERACAREGRSAFTGSDVLPSIPGYEIEGVIGHGGMGVVYRARHLKLDRVVAVKMLRSGDYASAKELAGLVREAQAIAGLKHPHIVQVHDVGELHGLPYFTMEFVEGGSLAQKLAGVPQAAMMAAEWMSVLAHAVQAAHERGIVHRDLKPANVLVGSDGMLKITDFGLARRFAGSGDTAVTMAARVGTPSYMPPEQALGSSDAFKPATDIYSLGAMLYEMITGRPPFRGESPSDTERQVINDEPLPPTRLNPRIPRDLQTICLKCLQKAPDRRYASAKELAEDVDRFRGGEPIRARPVGIAERTVKWARRRPAQATLIAVGLIVMATAFAAGLWYQSMVTARRAEVASRELESRGAIQRAIDQVKAAIDVEAWDDAARVLVNAAQRATEVKAPELDEQIASLTRAIGLARMLEETRQSRVAPLANVINLEQTLDGYAASFRAAGIPFDTDPRASAEMVRSSPIRQQLLAALDGWASLAYDLKAPEQAEELLVIAREADPGSAWRDRFRARDAWGDREAMLRLAADATVGVGEADGPSVHQIGLLGLRLWLMKEPDAGGELLRHVLGERPNDFWMNWELGRSFSMAKRFKDAIAPLRAATALRPQNAFACDLLARSLSEAGDPEEGITMYRRAVTLAPMSITVRRSLMYYLGYNGRWKEAEAEYKGLQAVDERASQVRLLFAMHLAERQRREEALIEFGTMLKEDPHHPIAQGYAGVCYYDLDRLAEAEEAFRDVARTRPGDVSPSIWLCRVLFRAGRIDEAIDEGQKALPRSSRVSVPQTPLGEMLIARGRLDEAVAAFEQFTRVVPSDIVPWIGQARAQLGLRKFTEAKASLDRAATLSGSAEQRRELDRIVELHKRITELGDRDPELLSKESMALDAASLFDVAEWNWRCAGRPAVALSQFRAAFTADPALLTIQGSRARLHAASAAVAAADVATSAAGELSSEDRASLRNAALEWLTSEREALIARREAGDGPERVAIADEFRTWLGDPALVAIGNGHVSDSISEGEARRWQELWRDIKKDAAIDNPGELLIKARGSVMLSDWPRALECYLEVFRLAPEQSGEAWFELAAAQLLCDDQEGYRRTVMAMVGDEARAAKIKPYLLARACTLSSLGSAELSAVAERAQADIQQALEAAWAITEAAAMKCRAGEHAAAIEILRRGLERDTRPGLSLTNWLWLALASEQSGGSAESERWFAKGDAWFERVGNERPPDGPSAIDLHGWLEAQVLRREMAAAMAARSGSR